MHLLLEVTPDAWETASFDVPRQGLRPGLVPADPVLRDFFPGAVRAYWREAASFHLVSHRERRSLHPASWAVSRRALRFVEELAPDVLHVDDVDVTPRLPLALPLLRRTPLVLSAHDPEPHSGERGWRKALSRRLAYPRAAGFVLHNERGREAFCRRHGVHPERVSVVRLGVYDILRAWSAPPPEAPLPTLLFLGRLSPYKGLDVLYRALPRVAEEVPEVRVVVAGRPVPGYTPPAPPRLSGPARVEVVERYVANPELARLMEGAAVVVCPYRDATQSGVVLTAFAFGKPVVASAVGGIGEYVEEGETGVLVPPGDPGALAEALVRTLTDPELRNRLRDGIRRARADRLDWGRAAEEMLEVYRRASRGSRAAPAAGPP